VREKPDRDMSRLADGRHSIDALALERLPDERNAIGE
jgi:hypothetical protein